jgi:molybdopterin biosynthesis enzyme
MAKRPNYSEALERVLALNYPPTTLTIDTAKAAGHRLAKPVLAKGNLPSRPVSLVDGLAVITADIVAKELAAAPEGADGAEDSGADEVVRGGLAEVSEEEERELEQQLGSLGQQPGSLEQEPADERADEPADERPPLEPVARLTLRPFPETNRREDALVSGQAIAVPIGGEVPRGGEIVYPLSELVADLSADEEPETAADESAADAPAAATGADNGNDDNGDEGDMPVAEPSSDWNLPARYLSGEVEIQRLPEEPPANMITIGSWARNHEPLVPERTVLRPSEMSLLLALGVEEVTIYRRPVVGVVSLGLPFPIAGKTYDAKDMESICPLAALATQLMRAARVAALPLGFAPKRFHGLVTALTRWVDQVDILLLVGGSHHGANCRGLDALRAAGSVEFSGSAMSPAGALSVGYVAGQPVLVMPGSLPDVLVGCVLLARPLAHKYLTPHQYDDNLELMLEYGSQLNFERDTVVPVRYSFDRERGVDYTRFNGRRHDAWLDYIRGQALVVLEGGRQYKDGEIVTAIKY